MDGAARKSPYRVWVGKAAVHAGTLPPAHLTVWKEHVDSLVPTCHLAAMAAGGPRTGSLVALVAHSPADGVSVRVPVEVTGDPAFGACIRRMLGHLPAPGPAVNAQVKFILYFEPSGSEAERQ